MKILITGGKGFVGSYLANNLRADNIVAVGKDKLDLLNPQQVNEFFNNFQFDVVIHTALVGREQLFSTDSKYLNENLLMFTNLYNNRQKFGRLFNLGTAYEYDLTKDNRFVHEESVINYLPNTSYGLAKNIIARIIKETDNFYNFRLFGVFHHTEKETRFFKKLSLQKTINISNDIYFDYISLDDLVSIIRYFLHNIHSVRDINCVYHEKFRLSHLAKKFCEIHNLDQANILVEKKGHNNLTGNATKLMLIPVKLAGLDAGLKLYQV